MLPCTYQSKYIILDLPSQNSDIVQSIYLLNLLHVYNLFTINTDYYFKLLTCSLDESPFIGETYLIRFVAELRTYIQTNFTSQCLLIITLFLIFYIILLQRDTEFHNGSLPGSSYSYKMLTDMCFGFIMCCLHLDLS